MPVPKEISPADLSVVTDLPGLARLTATARSTVSLKSPAPPRPVSRVRIVPPPTTGVSVPLRKPAQLPTVNTASADFLLPETPSGQGVQILTPEVAPNSTMLCHEQDQ